MRARLVILAALVGHSDAIPCRPAWVVQASLSWISASTRLDKLLSQIPTVYLGGGTVPPNATMAETTITTTITTVPVPATVTTSVDEDNATDSAKAGGNSNTSGPISTGMTTTTTTTITVTPSTSGTADASAAATSTESDKASEGVAKTEGTKVHRRATIDTIVYPERRQLTHYTTTTLPCPARTLEPGGLKTITTRICGHAAHRVYLAPPAPPAVVYTTINVHGARAALDPIHDAHSEADKTKDPRVHRRDFEGSKEEAKDLEILATLAQSKMGEAVRMRELFDQDLKEYLTDKKEMNAERISLKKEHTKARHKMIDAREWERKFNKAVKEYDAKQKKWKKETANKTTQGKEMKEKQGNKKEPGATKKNEKRDEPKTSELDLKTSDSFSEEEYEDRLYAGIGEQLLNGPDDTKERGGDRYVLTKKCNGSNCPSGKNGAGAEQGAAIFKVEEVTTKMKDEERKKKTPDQRKADLKEDSHQEEGEDELLAGGDEHGQYVRLSTLYMQYRSMLVEAIRKQLDPVLKDEKYATDETMEEHEEGNEEEQRRRLSNLYMDFRYMLLPKFKKQLDPILYDTKL
ncbi:hypothetical protein FHETE_10799 [Fusarium heterosporum]|uniref:Uncharacterized protein n=1 Tax=Fusarium heterosporum TaxID=42747 RepID=A0A8H5STI3_FUSHE|nr:hypothetical protein FHETE_10799 [Fusarium heterosporum]